MSELVQVWSVVIAGLVSLAFVVAMFACSNGESNFETFVRAWKEKRIAEMEVEKARLDVERAKYGLGAEVKP
jgi:hypothetical protein